MVGPVLLSATEGNLLDGSQSGCPFLLHIPECKTNWTTCCSYTGPDLSPFHVLVQAVPFTKILSSILLGSNLTHPAGLTQMSPLPEAFPALYNEKHPLSPLETSMLWLSLAAAF